MNIDTTTNTLAKSQNQFDSESTNDAMQIGEIATALASPGVPTMDIVSYDNCLMGMAEVGYAMSSSVKGLFVASEELVNGTGQDYTTAYSALKSPANPLDVTPGQLAVGLPAPATPELAEPPPARCSLPLLSRLTVSRLASTTGVGT